MNEIKVIAGTCGKGIGAYESGLFKMPEGGQRAVETLVELEIHGDVAPEAHWVGQIASGLKGVFSSSIKIAGPLSLAASAVGAGLGAINEGSRPRAVINAIFDDGSVIIALTDLGVANLIQNDRDVIRRALLRAGHLPQPAQHDSSDPSPSFSTQAAEVIHEATDAASAALSSAIGIFKRPTSSSQ